MYLIKEDPMAKEKKSNMHNYVHDLITGYKIWIYTYPYQGLMGINEK